MISPAQRSPFGVPNPLLLTDAAENDWMLRHILRGQELASLRPGKFGSWYEDFASLVNWTTLNGTPVLATTRSGVVSCPSNNLVSNCNIYSKGVFIQPNLPFYFATRMAVTSTVVTGSSSASVGIYDALGAGGSFRIGVSGVTDGGLRYSMVGGSGTWPGTVTSNIPIDTSFHDLELAHRGDGVFWLCIDHTALFATAIAPGSLSAAAHGGLVSAVFSGGAQPDCRCDKLLMIYTLP